MKNQILTAAVFLLLASTVACAQSVQRKQIPISKSTPVEAGAEIPAEQWTEITTALSSGNWDKTVSMSDAQLKRLKTENAKNQLARLRYFYLFALAGKVSQGKMNVSELKNITQTFIGKDFIMLDRNVLSDCSKSLNYLCPVRETNKAVRVTATNNDFTVIHAFEYVELKEEFDFKTNNLKNAFVGGKLKSAEFNEKPDKVWVMRLFFEEGWIQVAKNKA